MRAEFDGSDYYIYLLTKDMKKITTLLSSKGGFKYDWLESKIESEFLSDAFLMLTCTNNSRQAFASGKITFDREDEDNPKDITTRVFTGEILNLLERKIPYIMTRYDRENKIWLFFED